MKILCWLDRIGGITGKRIYIRRITSIGWTSSEYNGRLNDELSIYMSSKIDALDVFSPKTFLGRFIGGMNLQSQNRRPIQDYRVGIFHKEDHVGLITYEEGQATDIRMISISEILKTICEKNIPPLKEVTDVYEEEGVRYHLKNPMPFICFQNDLQE